MCSYLNSDRAVYAFRRSVPEHLRAYFLTPSGKQRTEWRISLGTKERDEAKRLCHLKAVETDEAIKVAQAMHSAGIRPPGQSTAASQREEKQFEYDQEAMRWREDESHAEDAEVEALQDDAAVILEALRGPLSSLPRAKAAMRLLIPDHEFDSPEEKRRAASAKLQAQNEAVKRHLPEIMSAIAGTPAYPSIRDLFAGYTKAKDLRAATIKRWKPVIEQFISFLGHDNAAKTKVADVMSWRDYLQRDDREGGPLNPTTVRDVYLAALKATFGWAVAERRIEANPVVSIVVWAPKKPKLRAKSLSRSEVRTILRGTLAPQPNALGPRHALARRWVPWLCAYTGARVNEITQIRGTDVALIEEVWTLQITPEAGSQKNNTARIVPLHSHLVEQGFPKVAEAAGSAPIFYDPELARGGKPANPQYKKVGERLAEWVRELGVTDPLVQPNHGWRHLFKTIGRTHGMEAEARDGFTGHASRTEGENYGEREIPYLARELEKFPRFEV
jgi:integrase